MKIGPLGNRLAASSAAAMLTAMQLAQAGCTKTEAKTAIDFAAGTCNAIAQDDPSLPYVDLICAAIDDAGHIVGQSRVRVARADYLAMRGRP